jgi:hypothetical protein
LSEDVVQGIKGVADGRHTQVEKAKTIPGIRAREEILMERVDEVQAVQDAVCDRNGEDCIIGERTNRREEIEVGRLRGCVLVH